MIKQTIYRIYYFSLTYNKNGAIITLASKLQEVTKICTEVCGRISPFFMLKKRQVVACPKDYSLFVSWFSLLLLLKSNKTINRQINSKEVTILAPPFS